MKHSENLDQLAPALAIAQGLIKCAYKDKDNPFFSSRYADLNAVWASCREQLSSNGLSVLQGCESREGKNYINTMILHKSGQWVKSEMEMTLPDPNVQHVDKFGKVKQVNVYQLIGSAMTYMRRINLAGMVGVAPGDDTDDDANCLTPVEKVPKSEKKLIKPSEEKKSAEHLETFEDWKKRLNVYDEKSAINQFAKHAAKKKGKDFEEVLKGGFENPSLFFNKLNDFLSKKDLSETENT